MARPAEIEVREPGRRPRRVVVDRGLEVGRECDGVLLADEGVSRRHVKLLPSPLGLSVVDLGSRNGTTVNGVRIDGRVTLDDRDVIRLGRTELVVIAPVSASPAEIPQHRILTLDSIAPLPPPPPLPAMAVVPSRVERVLRWAFMGREAAPDRPSFPNYLELPGRLPSGFWHLVRALSMCAYIALVVAMFVRPAGALFTFFMVIVPLLPILFFLAPGLWRNICPLAAANQTPRVLKFSKAFTAPRWLRERGYLVAIALFFGIAGARLAVFNVNGRATGVLLGVTILSAFLMGVTFRGKSGWCSSVCPLLPLQRVYGQTPFLVVANTHCQPCVACTKNCYDFKPQVAQQADLHDPDPQWSQPRRLFASALPGFVLGFFMLVGRTDLSTPHLYERLALYVFCSVGGFFALEALGGISAGMVTALWGAAALNVFYWYSSLTLIHAFETIIGTSGLEWLRWPFRAVVLALSWIWLSRTYWTERRFLIESGALPTTSHIAPAAAKALENIEASADEAAEVRFVQRDEPVPAEIGMSLLELAESCGLQIEAGCRMGVCGADPVAVLSGADDLSEPEDEELTTLRRLGLAPSTRMACCARIQTGSVQVSLTPERGAAGPVERPVRYDRSITSVVVIGNGISGVTAADFVRRGHPDCEIHLIGAESHLLYNRMGISRIVYGRSAMSGLYLLEEQWYTDNRITTWLNTLATDLDLANRRVRLGTGEQLVFDRLILAMGSSSTVPPFEGFGMPGTFVLRSADDASQIRAYAQAQGARQAVVAGAGLLGLEAAHALHSLGLQVTVLERGERLMSRNIDVRASALGHAHFDRLGIRVLYRAATAGLGGAAGRVDTVRLVDGRTLPCDAFLACVGITPNVDLARRAGIAVNRGVLVDDRMATRAPGVFAAGDVAEHGRSVLGLWPVGAKQGEVAALNALGGDERLVADNPAMILKGVGLELSAAGRIEPEPGDEVISDENPRLPSYRKLVISHGVVVGALVIGHHPDFLAAATLAVKKAQLVDTATLAELRRGNWLALKEAAKRPAAVV
ncbi:MAG: FAD-dependent oxidoreductase [Pseudonocardiales bacterium]